MVPLERAECLRPLGSVSLGRVVFTQNALPAIRPVNHVVADGMIVIRTHEGAALTAITAGGTPGAVVAYEADVIDPVTRLGWTVVATGYAQIVAAAHELARFEALLRPWVDIPMVYTVRIDPELVTGFRVAEQRADRSAAADNARAQPA